MAQRSTGTVSGVIAALAVVGVVVLWQRSKSRSKALPTRKAAPNPQIVLVFSGKRKSGKDYVTDKLLDVINRRSLAAGAKDSEVCSIGRLSAPLKKAYAEEHGLDFQELLSDGPYKEKYRHKMIVWGEAKRKADPGFFARIVLNSEALRPVLIISDARRRSDLDFFLQRTKKNATSGGGGGGGDGSGSSVGGEGWECIAVRIEACAGERGQRGFVHTPSVDEGESECGLDGKEGSWDVVVANDGEAALPAGGGDGGAVASSNNHAASVPWDHTEVGKRGAVDRQIEALAAEVLRRLGTCK